MTLRILTLLFVTALAGCSTPDKVGGSCEADHAPVCNCPNDDGFIECTADGWACHCPGDEADADMSSTDASGDATMDVGSSDASMTDTGGPTDMSRPDAPIGPLIYAPETVVFPQVPPVTASTRNTYWRLAEVQNVGTSDLTLSDISLTPDDTFSVSYPTSAQAAPSTDGSVFPGSIAPGESFLVRVYFNPLDRNAKHADLVISSNDAAQPLYLVALSGNTVEPCIQLNEEVAIDFGATPVGSRSQRTVVVQNCSRTTDLSFDSVNVCSVAAGMCNSGLSIFSIEAGTLPAGLPGSAAVIAPLDSADFVITYAPQAVGPASGELEIASNDPDKSPLLVPLRGSGIDDNACPTAVAEGKVSTATTWSTNIQTEPLQTISLRGIASSDPDGTVDRYEWAVIRRPINSSSRLLPNTSSVSPSLFLDLTGQYIVELKVFDDDGTESCGNRALVTIDALPDQDIHVQLVWDTPSDSDQTDSFGTDFDLHFLHPNGMWNNAPYDIYWLNPTAEWGVPGGMDDPSLDIDDTNGAGPENINLQDPQPVSYEVGAYYYADNGYGASYATIRIYLDGALTYEYRDQPMLNLGMFWHAATINWATRSVAPVNNVVTGFPN